MYKSPQDLTGKISANKKPGDYSLREKAALAARQRQVELDNILLSGVFRGDIVGVLKALAGEISSPIQYQAIKKLEQAEAAILSMFDSDNDGTALSKSYIQAYLEVEAIEKLKANPNAQISYSRGHALYHAVRLRHYEIALVLLEHGADVQPKTSTIDGSHHHLSSPFNVAVKNGDQKMLKLLLAFEADPFQDSHFTDRSSRKVAGWTALHVASHYGQYHLIETLVTAMAEQILKNLAITAREFRKAIAEGIAEVQKHGSQAELDLLKIKYKVLLDNAAVELIKPDSTAGYSLAPLVRLAHQVSHAKLAQYADAANTELQAAAKLMQELDGLSLRELTQHEIAQPVKFTDMNCHKKVFNAFEAYFSATSEANFLLNFPDKFINEILDRPSCEDQSPLSLAAEAGCAVTLAMLSPKPQQVIPDRIVTGPIVAPQTALQPNTHNPYYKIAGLIINVSPIGGLSQATPSPQKQGYAGLAADYKQAAEDSIASPGQ